MKYEAVYLHTREGHFVGASIRKVGTQKLHDTNIWTDGEADIAEFRETLERLNSEDLIRQYWPDAHDPEVERLVNNPEWEPLELHEEQVPDWDSSDLIEDEFGGIDQEKSHIVYKQAMVPDPTEAQQRYYKAQEIVARSRALAASA